MSSLHGVGSIATIKGRDRFEKETTACPGARLGSVLHRLSSTPPIDLRSRLTTLESPILCRTQLLIDVVAALQA